MNETHGPSTSGGISQDIPGYASLGFLLVLQVAYPKICQFRNLILAYPGICKSTQYIPSYPAISHFRKLVLGYPGISRLAQPVVFPDEKQEFFFEKQEI